MADSASVRLSNKAASWSLISLLSLYFAIHFFQTRGLGSEILRYYGKDIIFLPTLLLCVKITADLLGTPMHLKRAHLWIAFVYTVVVFELVLPMFSAKYHRDPFDVAAYALGLAICHIIPLTGHKGDKSA